MTDQPLCAPFRGERFADPASLARRLAPPYDVIDPPQRAQLAARDPANIVHADLPVAPDGGDPYAVAARLLASWRGSGVLAREAAPSAYVLRTTSRLEDGGARARTGVFLALAAEPFSRGRVLPHEQTHQGPKEDRRRLTHATQANLSPIFVLAPDADGGLAALLASVTARAPWATAEAIGASHAVWIVAGAEAAAIAGAAGAAPVYIADGHHRYETAALVREEAPDAWRAGAARTLAHVVSFRDPGLSILPTHRIVPGRPLDRDAVLAAVLGPHLESCEPGRAALTLVFHDGSEVPVTGNPEADLERVPALPGVWAWGLPSWMCDDLLVRQGVAPLLGGVPQFRYTAAAAEARAAAREPGVAFAVLLRPTALEEVKRISDLGQVMPPKSTYFAPKVPTGVVLRPFL